MEAEISEVSHGLYVGGLSSLKYLEPLGITHVLSVLNFPLQKDLSAYVTLQLPLQDSPGANMLQYLPAAIKFLDAALGQQQPAAGAVESPTPAAVAAAAAAAAASGKGGGTRVLVHCQAGVSRSPAVVAAWLMRCRGLSADSALALLASRRRCVDPNEGFRAQLALFGDMRCSLDPNHPVYRMWCLEELASRWEEHGYVDPVAFAQLPDGPAGLPEAVAAQQTLYRCRKCRQLLATSAHVVPVEEAKDECGGGGGHRVFRDRQRLRQVPAASNCATADGSGAESCLFVEPMQWMAATVTGVVAGKLHCPKCAARLGSFDWSGISNPSGVWVTPAFQLHISKVDTVLPKPLEALANVRRPLVGPARGTGLAAAAAPAAAGAATGADGARLAAAAAAAPSLPATLPAAVRRLGLGRAGAREADEGEEQLPEPQLVLDPGAPDAATATAASAPGVATAAVDAEAGSGTQAQTRAPRTAEGSEEVEAKAAADAARRSCNGSSSSSGSCSETQDSGGCEADGSGRAAMTATRRGAPSDQDQLLPAGACCPGTASAAACASAWFTHLILDCDGVLVDSEAASCEALRRAILEVTDFDIPHTFPRDYIEVFGMDVRSCVAHYRERFNRTDWEPPELLAPRVQAAKEVHYKQLTEGGVPAFDGAERLIRRALDAGMQVGVASSGAPEKIAHNLASSGLAPLIPAHTVISASHVAAGKPAPDVYLAAMKATGCLHPRKALVVEDAVNGLKAARAAGMITVGITNQLSGPMLAPWADFVVSHLDEVDPLSFVPPSAAAAAAAVLTPLTASDYERQA